MIDRFDLVMDDPPSIRALARLLDHVLNAPPKRHRREGFILLRFSHERITCPTYVSTCPDDQTVKVLKLMLAQLEGRLEGKAGHA